MKNLFTILTVVFLITSTFMPRQAIAQSPEKLNYQAVIRDSNGHVITNQIIGMQISILQGSASGTAVYTETQLITSNANGLIKTEIGTGTVVTGDFSTIDWVNGPYFLHFETDPNGGTNYTVTGTNQLLSVPYAMHAKTSDSLTDIDSFSWSTTGNAGTDPASNFIGTTDDQALILKVNNLQAGKISRPGLRSTFFGIEAGVSSNSNGANTAVGYFALQDNTNGYNNTAIGAFSLRNNTLGHSNIAIGLALSSNTEGFYNTAMGHYALKDNTTGNGNQAIGAYALYSNTTGSSNIAVGVSALRYNTTGDENIAIGRSALHNNTTGIENTAVGFHALLANTIGVANTAHGYDALSHNSTGNHNTAIGSNASYRNDNGQRNTSIGSSALYTNISGSDNTAIGFTALRENTEGNDNTAVGRTALFSNHWGDENTAMGRSALYYNTSGDKNTAFGRNALVNITNGSNNTGIGYDAQVPTATASNQVRIGNADVSYAGIQVSWSITSDKIWKEQIRELPYGIDMLMQLKPVDYYRKNNDVKTREMGFIAQDVEVLLKQMGYDDQGFLTKADNGNLSLRYNDFIALLTKGMQEQQEIIEQLNNENEQQNSNFKKLLKRVEQLEGHSTK